MALSDAERQTLVMAATDDDGSVLKAWDQLWPQTADMDVEDPSGELRLRATIVLAFDMVRLPAASGNVSTSEGGQSGQWSQYYDHLLTLREKALAQLNLLIKGELIRAMSVVRAAPLLARSLTPPYPGQLDPGSPGYAGDPRFWRTDAPVPRGY